VRKALALVLPLFLFSLVVQASDNTPKDFKLVFHSSSGALERGTKQTIEVVKGTVTVRLNAEKVGEEGVQTKDDKVYKISDDQLNQLYQVVTSSGFMTWPKNSEGPHQSTVEESFDITANGKTVTHGRWEQGSQDTFRNFYESWNSWFNGIRTARF